MPWFTTKGQILQTLAAFFVVYVQARNAWPDMMASNYFSTGAILFYVLVAVVLGSSVSLIIAIKRGRMPSPEEIADLKAKLEVMTNVAIKKDGAIQTCEEVGAAKNRPDDKATLEILWKPGEMTYHMHYGEGMRALHYRICIVNLSDTKLVRNVRVRLEALYPPVLPCVPCLLRQMNDIPGPYVPYKESFDLSPGKEQFIDLLAQGPDDANMWVLHTVKGIPELVKKQPYKLIISVTSDNAASDTKTFELFENGPYWHMRYT